MILSASLNWLQGKYIKGLMKWIAKVNGIEICKYACHFLEAVVYGIISAEKKKSNKMHIIRYYNTFMHKRCADTYRKHY